MSAAAIRREALRLWWEREATLPPRLRRAPDALDVATGAWDRVASISKLEIVRPVAAGSVE